jgi:NADH:ubiquinone oxidoreductase subunit E
MDTITVCMGSSCFGRGNSVNAEAITRFAGKHHLQDRVEVTGCLCCKACIRGPNIRINEKLFSGVSEETLEAIIAKELGLEP